MLEKIDLKKKLNKKEYKLIMEDLEPRISFLQRQCKAAKIPVLIVFEGWGSSGKGTLINQLIRPIDPRGFKVFTLQKVSEDEAMRPYLWRFWTKIPAKGRINIFDRSWYRKAITGSLGDVTSLKKNEALIEEIIDFEQELVEDGMIIIKFFLHISKKEQKRRFRNLERSEETSWRIGKHDWFQNEHYETYFKIIDEIIVKTDTDFAPWTIVESTDKEYATSKIIDTVTERLEKALKEKEIKENEEKEIKQESRKIEEEIREEESTVETDLTEENSRELNEIRESLKINVLKRTDMSVSMEKDEYKKKLKELQEKLAVLHYEMYKKRVPVVIAFEGWDAGGKGGAIKRLTENIDPRGYEVIPVGSPNDIEREHHYLWRFWNSMPKAGHMTIFDRTWYGRVMVERIEGFCSENEWQRAYKEINHMEEDLANFGCVVIKFWMNIDKDEQLRRFKERENTPGKTWKITEEDWRNREKWDEYEKVVNEMLIKTSTTKAPWVVVEANSKYYARIKVLQTVVDTLEKRMNEIKADKNK